MYVAALFAITSCDCSPASDQLCQLYVVPPRVCGVVAEIVFREPLTTVCVNGVAAEVELTASWSPLGAVANDRTTVFGLRLTEVVACSPPLSVAVSWISSQLG